MTIGTSGFGTANTGGDADTNATVYIDEEGLHLGPAADVFITNEDGVEARVTGSLTHPDISLYGVANAAFEDGPIDPTMDITPWPSLVASNFMPNWRFVQSSNTNITAKQVRDTNSPSGSNLRFTFVSGASNDEAFAEQIIPVGGMRSRWGGATYRVSVLRVTATTTFRAFIDTQYLDVSRTVVGSSGTGTVDMGADATLYPLGYNPAGGLGTSPPATARFVRVRIGIRRIGGAGNTGTFDFADIRGSRADPYLMVAESVVAATYSQAVFTSVSGTLNIVPGHTVGTGDLTALDLSVALGTRAHAIGGTGAGNVAALSVQEQGTPANASIGYLGLWADTSHHLHTIDQSGTDTDLTAVVAATVPPIILTSDFVKTTGTAGTFANLTGLSFPCVNGKNYLIQGFGTYTCSATTGGINLAYNAPAGTVFAEWEVATASVGSYDVVVRQQSTDQTNAGAATVGSTASRPFRFAIRYVCTANGTFTLRIARTGTVNTVTVEAGSGMFVGVA